MKGSKKYSLNAVDGMRILKGAGVALAGATLVYMTDVMANVEFGAWTPIATALFAVFANFIRVWIADNRTVN